MKITTAASLRFIFALTPEGKVDYTNNYDRRTAVVRALVSEPDIRLTWYGDIIYGGTKMYASVEYRTIAADGEYTVQDGTLSRLMQYQMQSIKELVARAAEEASVEGYIQRFKIEVD
jgi:hypothetical protein